MGSKTTSLDKICKAVHNSSALRRKQGIGNVVKILQETSRLATSASLIGDDAAVILHEKGCLLLAADGIMDSFLEAAPYEAGKASVIVNVNDIYAMGGRPLAMVNVMAATTGFDYTEVFRGIRDGCRMYHVPMVGGHFHPDARAPSLAVSILGRGDILLTSDSAEKGQNIIVAMDLEGKTGSTSLHTWDSSSHRTPEENMARLEILTIIAQRGLCKTAKDISNGGMLVTIAAMLEFSRKGATVDLEKIPRPEGCDFLGWLLTFPSYGFIITADDYNVDECIDLFQGHGIAAEVIGTIEEGRTFTVSMGSKTQVLFDFSKDTVTGIS